MFTKTMKNPGSSIIILLLIAVVVILVSPSIQYVRFAQRADEGYYLLYAQEISNKGLPEFRNIFNSYIKNQKNWVFPNPLRIGAILIFSVSCKALGTTFLALAYLSFFSYILFIIINYIFCCRVFDKETARLLSFLIAFSPINMAMSRRALPDTLATLFLGLSLWLFLDSMINKEKNTVKKIIFLFTFSASILIKESCILFAVPLFIFLVTYKTIFKGRINWLDSFYLLVYPGILVLATYLIAAGNLSTIINVMKSVLTAVKTNSYAIMFGSGPWFRYIIDYMLLSPWILILSVGYVFYIMINLDKIDIREIFFLIILLVSLFMFSFLTKNVRYVMILDLPLRLFSVLMLQKLSKKIIPGHAAISAFGIIVVLSLFDYLNFSNLFLHRGIYDPVTFEFLRAGHIIP